MLNVKIKLKYFTFDLMLKYVNKIALSILQNIPQR